MQVTSKRSDWLKGTYLFIVNVQLTERFYPDMPQERILKVDMESFGT